jgi:hypothetical protein
MKRAFPKIDLIEVKSSSIAAIGHHPKNGAVRIQFRSGGTYDGPCTAEEYEAFAKAESLGKHFHQHLRGREFRKHPPKKAA